MDKRYIHILLTRFFEKDFPQDVRNRFGSWFIKEEQSEEKNEILHEIWNSLPETTDMASWDELKKVNKKIRSKPPVFYRRIVVAAIILLPLLSIVSTSLYYRYIKTVPPTRLVECFVPNGERKQVVLPDGSTVWLNSGSLLLYPDAFEGGTRTLYLSGEGNFTVTGNKEKPFIVKTNYIEVEALGTVFNVHSYPDENKTTTILESGKVKVDDKSGISGPVILLPDEALVYHHADASFQKSNVDASRLSSWKDGYLVFQQENVNTIFRSLERRYNVKINYNDNKFTSQTYTVRFHAEETLEEALDILKRIGLDFKFNIEKEDVYIQ